MQMTNAPTNHFEMWQLGLKLVLLLGGPEAGRKLKMAVHTSATDQSLSPLVRVKQFEILNWTLCIIQIGLVYKWNTYIYCTLGCETSCQNVTYALADWNAMFDAMNYQLVCTSNGRPTFILHVLCHYVLCHFRSLSMKCDVERTALSRGYSNRISGPESDSVQCTAFSFDSDWPQGCRSIRPFLKFQRS
jgi:hypothetical protein